MRWLSPAGQDIEDAHWDDANAKCFGMLLDGRAQASGIKRPAMDATALLVEKVRKGGSGVYGPIPMSPNGPDKINDADLKAAVELILKTT